VGSGWVDGWMGEGGWAYSFHKKFSFAEFLMFQTGHDSYIKILFCRISYVSEEA
jgi:hypothetical protein